MPFPKKLKSLKILIWIFILGGVLLSAPCSILYLKHIVWLITFYPLAPCLKTLDAPGTVELVQSGGFCKPGALIGRILIKRESKPLEAIDLVHLNISLGGYFKPSSCSSRSKIAIIVPYRDRDEHLRIFLHHLHLMLQRQELHYQIFVVEQLGNVPFNRGLLLNVGFLEATKVQPFDCLIFHDVSLIPEDDRNIYGCSEGPIHMSVAIDKFGYKLLSYTHFGGVLSMRPEHFLAVNGFSNMYWGWGGEDDDIFARVVHRNLCIWRRGEDVARYVTLEHQAQEKNPSRYKLLRTGLERLHLDGVGQAAYAVENVIFKTLFVHIRVVLFNGK